MYKFRFNLFESQNKVIAVTIYEYILSTMCKQYEAYE